MYSQHSLAHSFFLPIVNQPTYLPSLLPYLQDRFNPPLPILQPAFSHSVTPWQNTQHYAHFLQQRGLQTYRATAMLLGAVFFHSTKPEVYFFLPFPQKAAEEAESLVSWQEASGNAPARAGSALPGRAPAGLAAGTCAQDSRSPQPGLHQ